MSYFNEKMFVAIATIANELKGIRQEIAASQQNCMKDCLVRLTSTEHPIKCKFHCWSHMTSVIPPSPMVGGHNGGQVSYTVGIVEDEEGCVRTVYPNDIKFIGGENNE